jgi:8-hydroxy-5-deazaflavin:NADPH oxidoreductase
MKVTVLGTGMVGRALAGRLAGLGHTVTIGTRDVEATLARSRGDEKGTPPFAEWQARHPGVVLKTFSEAASAGDLVINASAGLQSLAVLEAAGPANLAGKVLLDLAVPLDYSQGRPPRLAYANDDSLGERIQRAFPDSWVVKALNTMHVQVMVDPARVPGQHNVFVAGNEARAKAEVGNLLAEFGWPPEAVIDLGGITAARVTEMYVPLLFAMMRSLGTSDLNMGVLRR